MRIAPDRDVDFLAVCFLLVWSRACGCGVREDSTAPAAAESENEPEDDVEDWEDLVRVVEEENSSPHTLPVVVSIQRSGLPRCCANECCLSCNLKTDPHARVLLKTCLRFGTKFNVPINTLQVTSETSLSSQSLALVLTTYKNQVTEHTNNTKITT